MLLPLRYARYALSLTKRKQNQPEHQHQGNERNEPRPIMLVEGDGGSWLLCWLVGR